MGSEMCIRDSLHFDREAGGFWAEDGSTDAARRAAAASGAFSSTDDDGDGEDAPDVGGVTADYASGGGGRAAGRAAGRARGDARGRGVGGHPTSQLSGQQSQAVRNTAADHRRKGHGQQQRAYAKQGRPF